MKALVKSKPEPGIWLEEVPKPTIGPNDLLVRVHYASICGTDLHIVNWDAWAQRTIKVPLVIGHEFEGTIVAIGSEVSGFTTGQRVAVEGHVTCGHCRNCRAGRRHLCRNTQGIGVQRPGAFAESSPSPRRMGATLAVDYRTTTLDAVMKDLGMLEGFDIGLEMSGAPEALRSMLQFMNHGGRVALLGIPSQEIPIAWDQVIFRGLTLKGI